MRLLLVTFAVDSVRKQGVESALKAAKTWWHYFDTVWIIGTNQSLTAWHAKLKTLIANSDSLFIVDITNRERNGWLPQRAWQWLDENEKVNDTQNSQIGHAPATH